MGREGAAGEGRVAPLLRPRRARAARRARASSSRSTAVPPPRTRRRRPPRKTRRAGSGGSSRRPRRARRRRRDVAGDEDDPLVGSRRLSELIGRYTIRLVGEEVIEGRPAYVLDFSPNPTAPAPKGLGDRALNALEGRAVIDAVHVPGPLRRGPPHAPRQGRGRARREREGRRPFSYAGQPARRKPVVSLRRGPPRDRKDGALLPPRHVVPVRVHEPEAVPRGDRNGRPPRRGRREHPMTPSRRRTVLLAAGAVVAAAMALRLLAARSRRRRIPTTTTGS